MPEFIVDEILAPWCELKRVTSRTAVPIEKGTGIPEHRNFRIIDNKIYVLPEETVTDMALRVFYFRRDDDPSGEDDLENGWMKHFPDLFIAEVGLRLATDLEDTGAMRYFSSMRQEARKAYDDKVEEEAHAAQVLSF